jgi:hypothetical protein
VRDGGRSDRTAGVRHTQPHAVIGAMLEANARDNCTSCIEQRAGDAAVVGVARLELARVF